jgi:2'-5' RNA ligase
MSANKYFIAIIIPEPFLTQAESVKLELQEKFGLKGALRSPAHITLHRPFEWRSGKENELISKLSDFSFPENFTLQLNGFSCFAPRVIYIDLKPNEILDRLHAHLKNYARSKLLLFNEAEDERGFHPHITVAFRDLRKNKFGDVWDHLKGRDLSGSFEAKGISLLRLENKWEQLRFFPFKEADAI